jgi:hypothetical protein
MIWQISESPRVGIHKAGQLFETSITKSFQLMGASKNYSGLSTTNYVHYMRHSQHIVPTNIDSRHPHVLGVAVDKSGQCYVTFPTTNSAVQEPSQLKYHFSGPGSTQCGSSVKGGVLLVKTAACSRRGSLSKSEGPQKWLAPCGADVHRVAPSLISVSLRRDLTGKLK